MGHIEPSSVIGQCARVIRAYLNKPVMALFYAGLRLTRADRPKLVLIVGLAIITGAMEVLLIGLIASVIVVMTGTTLPKLPYKLHGLPVNVALMAGGGMLAGLVVLAFPLARLQASFSTSMIVRLRERLLLAYQASSLQWRDRHRENFLVQLIGEYCNRAEQMVQFMVWALTTMAVLVMFVIAAITIAPRTALILLGAFGLFFLLLSPLIRKKGQSKKINTHLDRDLAAQVGQIARLSDEIAAFQVGGKAVDALKLAVGKASAALFRLRYENRLVPSLYQYGGMVVVLVLIAIRQIAGRRDYTGLVPLAFLLLRALGYVRSFGNAVQLGSEQLPFVETLEEELRDLEAHAVGVGTLFPRQFAGLSFEDVAYAYKPGQPVLEGVTFEIHPNEFIGVAGPSGGGKSTLASLALRIRMPGQGHIRTGGMTLNEVSATAWASLCAFVGQDSKLIFGSVADNIRFFRPQYSLSQIRKAAQSAHLDSEISALPEGYDTLVGPGARGLSGGQRQRLAIARALLGMPQLLVLDEPTSALDQLSEQLITQTLQELKGQATIIVIAHRPATLAICDRVLHVESGRVQEVFVPRS